MKRTLALASVAAFAAASAVYVDMGSGFGRILSRASRILPAHVFAAETVPTAIEIKTLSTDASRVTGGDGAVQAAVPPSTTTPTGSGTGAGRDGSGGVQNTSPKLFRGPVTRPPHRENTP